MDTRAAVETIIEEGKRYFQQGQYRPAIESFEKALALDPGNGHAVFEAGKAYYVLQEYAKALDCLGRSAQAFPDDRRRQNDARLLMAKAWKSLGEYDRAVRLLAQCREAGADREEIEEELKKIYNDEYANILDVADFGRDYRLLAEEYKRRLEINRGDVKSIAHLAQVYNFQGLYHLSVPLIEQHLRLLSDRDLFFKNKLTNELEIALGRTTLASRVRRLTVTLSNRCNISCIMCLTSKHKWELPKERIDEIVSLFPYLEKIMWQGGEVFALEYFKDLLVGAAKHPNIRQSIVTNGQLLDEEISEELVRNNVELTFSVDGVSRETYEHIRRGARFDVLVRNIERINELRKRYRSNFVMNMNVAVMASNYREINGFLEFAARHRFEFLCLMPIHTHLQTAEDIFSGNNAEALRYLAGEMKGLERRARELNIRLENRLPLPRPEPGPVPERKDEPARTGTAAPGAAGEAGRPAESKKLCHIPWYQLLLDYDGTVRPDCLCPLSKNAGTLTDLSLEEVWNNDMMQEYRRRMAAGDYSGFCNDNCIQGKIAEEHLKFV